MDVRRLATQRSGDGPWQVVAQITEQRLEGLLDLLCAALEGLNLARTRQVLALIELLAERQESGLPGRAAFHAHACRAMFALVEGDLAGALALVERAEEIGRWHAVPGADAVVRTLRHDRARQLGDLDTLLAGAATCEAAGGLLDRAEAAVLLQECGETDRAARLVDDLAAEVYAVPDARLRRALLVRLAEAALGSGRPAVARAAGRSLLPHAGTAVVVPGGSAFLGVVDDHLARISGDAERAVRAREQYEALGAAWWSRRPQLPAEPEQLTPLVLHLHPTTEDASTWCVGADGRTREVAAVPGLEHLRALVRHPGQELAAQRDRGADAHAHVRVRQSIAVALAHLERLLPEVGAHLRQSLHTGLVCRYDPDPRRLVAWYLDAGATHAAGV